jgi:RNA polymerase sigma-70 factor (ECF subfamily)
LRYEKESSEPALVAGISHGYDDALREVIDRHGAQVFGVAWRILRRANLAEEATQDAFLALWMRPEVFDPQRGNLRSFLLRIVRNKSIDRVRREEARREDLTSSDDEQLPDEKAGQMAETLSTQMDMKETLDGLTEKQREAIDLVYFGGRTTAQMAEELGIPEGTAKTRIRDGLQHLRAIRGVGND